MNFSRLAALFSVRALQMAAWGALGGFIGFLLGEPLGLLFGFDRHLSHGALAEILITAFWTGLIGVGMGSILLIADNALSLRGRWQRNVLGGAGLFFVFGAVSGAIAQTFYDPALRWVSALFAPDSAGLFGGLLMLFINSLVRGLAWAMLGVGLGVGIGVLRRDWKAALRGALGGIIGGYHGGVLFDVVGASAGGGSTSRCVGLIITGAAIAWCMRVAQEALRSAWLLGISTGPYEGKEYPLNTGRITVGRSETNDLALYRDETVPTQLGAFVYGNNTWWWEGAPILIDGVSRTRATLSPQSIVQLGTYAFKFFDRARVSTPTTAQPPSTTHAHRSNTVESVAMSSVPTYTVPSPLPPRTVPLANMPVADVTSSPGHSLVLTPLDAIHRPFSLAVTARAIVGRASANDWSLAEATVSGQHALLSLENGLLIIRDLDSTNGTFVNGVKLVPNEPTLLREGDRVKFGQIECLVGRR